MTDLLIKKMPDDLKAWIVGEANRHRRSINKETIFLLEQARARRGAERGSEADIKAALARLQALPDRDDRAPDHILGYDSDGLPR